MAELGAWGIFLAILFAIFLTILAILIPLFVWRIAVRAKQIEANQRMAMDALQQISKDVNRLANEAETIVNPTQPPRRG